MAKPFLSPQTLSALANVISGGSSSDSTPPIGVYRSGYQLGQFMLECNVDFNVGSQSRVPALLEKLKELQSQSNGVEILTEIIEKAVSPAKFIGKEEKLKAVTEYMNKYLKYDNLELRMQGNDLCLFTANKGTAVLHQLAQKTEVIDFDTVRRELDRALKNIDADPEVAITAACSSVESVLRSVLVELNIELPKKKDIQNLYDAVRVPLGISPEVSVPLPDDILKDTRTILGGLNSVVYGIGALRTHVGNAHGRERKFKRPDARIARLAINTASTLALFIIETWESKYPQIELHRHV